MFRSQNINNHHTTALIHFFRHKLHIFASKVVLDAYCIVRWCYVIWIKTVVPRQSCVRKSEVTFIIDNKIVPSKIFNQRFAFRSQRCLLFLSHLRLFEFFVTHLISELSFKILLMYAGDILNSAATLRTTVSMIESSFYFLLLLCCHFFGYSTTSFLTFEGFIFFSCSSHEYKVRFGTPICINIDFIFELSLS